MTSRHHFRADFAGARCLLLSDLSRAGQNLLMQKWPRAELRADILVTGGLIVTLDQLQPVIQGGAVAILGGRIVAVGPSGEVAERYSARKTVDARGKAVMPGLVDTHHHFLQNFHKGTRVLRPERSWQD